MKRAASVCVNGVPMVGLNPALHLAFYPHYAFSKATQGPCGVSCAISDGLTAKARGRQVDDLTQLLCRLVRNGTPLAALDANAEWTQRSTESYRTQIVPYLLERKLTPIASQFQVAHAQTRVGTPIDMVCRDADGNAVIIEHKRGYEAYIDRHTGVPMKPPFYFLTDSARHQHLLYLAFAVDLFELQTGRTVNRAECAVLRQTSAGLDVYRLPAWSTKPAIMNTAWTMLAQRSAIKKPERSRMIRNAKRRKTNK